MITRQRFKLCRAFDMFILPNIHQFCCCFYLFGTFNFINSHQFYCHFYSFDTFNFLNTHKFYCHFYSSWGGNSCRNSYLRMINGNAQICSVLMTLDPFISKNLSCIDLEGHCALSLPGCLLNQEQDQELEMRHLYQQQLICGIPCLWTLGWQRIFAVLGLL